MMNSSKPRVLRSSMVMALALSCLLANTARGKEVPANTQDVEDDHFFSLLAMKFFIRYAKTTLSLTPTRDNTDLDELTNTSANVVTLQPPAAPAIGFAISYQSWLNIVYAQISVKWQC